MAKGVFWTGENGATYVKDSRGVRKASSAGFITGGPYSGYSRIADPDPGKRNAQAASSGSQTSYYASGGGGGGGGYSAPAPQVNQAAVNNTQSSINQLAGLLSRALAANRSDYNAANALFNKQEKQQRESFDKGVVTNQQNYDRNLMASLKAGIGGLKGLMSTLGGAARGTAGKWAQDVTKGQASRDIQTGADTQKQNQGALENTLNTFLNDLSEKKRQNENTFRKNEYSIRGDNASQYQKLYKTMADLYASGGDNAKAQEFLSKSGSYTPQIARYGVAPRAAFDKSTIKVEAPKLADYSGATAMATKLSGGDTGDGNPFIISRSRKRQDEE